MSKIVRKIETLQASLANAASTYFITQEKILNAEYSVTVVEDGGFVTLDEGENLDVLVTRMANALKWMNQAEKMLANLVSDYYRDLAVEMGATRKVRRARPAQAAA